MKETQLQLLAVAGSWVLLLEKVFVLPDSLSAAGTVPWPVASSQALLMLLAHPSVRSRPAARNTFPGTALSALEAPPLWRL